MVTEILSDVRLHGGRHFLNSLARADHWRTPFDHWLLADMLPSPTIDALSALPFPSPQQQIFNGQRDGDAATRVYFTPAKQFQFPVCRDVVRIFNDPAMIAALAAKTGANLAGGRLRIEYCQDADGFWLAPHLDLPVKLFTMLIYLSDNPTLRDAGTDIYDSNHRLYASAPYEQNKGLIFIPGTNTWHGFSPRPIKGIRKSLIINYVSPDWRNTGELARPR